MPSAVTSNGNGCVCEGSLHCKCWQTFKTQTLEIRACNSYIQSCNFYSRHLGTFESKCFNMATLLYNRVYKQSIPFKGQVSNGMGHRLHQCYYWPYITALHFPSAPETKGHLLYYIHLQFKIVVGRPMGNYLYMVPPQKFTILPILCFIPIIIITHPCTQKKHVIVKTN